MQGLQKIYAKIVGKNVFSLLTKISREQRQHEIELASAKETTSKLRASSDFGSRTFTGTFSSTIIGRISSEILSEHDEFVASKFIWRHMSTFHITSPSHRSFKPRLHVLTLLYNICWFNNVRMCSRHVR